MRDDVQQIHYLRLCIHPEATLTSFNNLCTKFRWIPSGHSLKEKTHTDFLFVLKRVDIECMREQSQENE
jgi:hypothetical protein